MTKHEMIFVVSFLEDLNDGYSNDGCNDLDLKATPENIELAIVATKNETGEDEEFKPNKKGNICCINTFIVLELQKRIMNEFGITKKDLIKV